MPKNETKRVDRTSIVVSDSRFSAKPIFVFATEIFCGHKESAVWRSDAGQAEILVVDTYENCIVRPPLDDESIVALRFKWLNETGVSFKGEPMKTEGSLGTVWGRRFTREDRDCYFFRHAFEAHHFSYYSDPTTWMIGYFCAPSGTTMDNASIQRFVSSISLNEIPVKSTEVDRSPASTVASTLAPKQDFDRAVTASKYPPERDVAYSLNGTWAGIAGVITGKFFYERRGTSGVFELQMPAEAASCRGTWARSRYDLEGFTMTAKWIVKCPGTTTASGTFRYASTDVAEMYGADQAGNFMSFSLWSLDPNAAEMAATTKQIPFAWEGVASNGIVVVEYKQLEGPGGLSFADNDGVIDCKGGWFLDGRWTARCANGRTLSGRSFRFQHGTILGTGTDDLGRSFRFGET